VWKGVLRDFWVNQKKSLKDPEGKYSLKTRQKTTFKNTKGRRD